MHYRFWWRLWICKEVVVQLDFWYCCLHCGLKSSKCISCLFINSFVHPILIKTYQSMDDSPRSLRFCITWMSTAMWIAGVPRLTVLYGSILCWSTQSARKCWGFAMGSRLLELCVVMAYFTGCTNMILMQWDLSLPVSVSSLKSSLYHFLTVYHLWSHHCRGFLYLGFPQHGHLDMWHSVQGHTVPMSHKDAEDYCN